MLSGWVPPNILTLWIGLAGRPCRFGELRPESNLSDFIAGVIVADESVGALCVAFCYTLWHNVTTERNSMPDRVTRVAADLVDSAAAEGARQSRSAKQQLDHWARVGRAVSSQHTASRRRVEAALAGDLALSELSAEEGVVVNAEISAAIEENLARTHYGEALAARGITTVALDDAGDLIEHRPDGTSVALTKKRRRRAQSR